MLYLLKGIVILLALWVTTAQLLAQDLQRAPISQHFGSRQLAGETNIWQLAEGPDGQIIAAGERIGYYQNGQWEFLPSPRIQDIHCLLLNLVVQAKLMLQFCFVYLAQKSFCKQ